MEEELIKKAKNGNEEAYVKLVQKIEKDLYRIASVKLNNIEDINDVIQETMIKSFINIKKLNKYDSFKAWIMKILINECNKFYIRKYRKINLLDKIIKNENDFSYEITNIDNKVDFDLLIRNLSHDEQIIIILYFSGKYTTGEISNILNINVNTVKTRLRRAEEKLREMIGEGENKDE